MAKIRVRKESGKLYFDFFIRGDRCREQTLLADSPENRKQLQKISDRIEADLKSGAFVYGKIFPNSPMAAKFPATGNEAAKQPQASRQQPPVAASSVATPKFKDFTQTWVMENEVRWRSATRALIRGTLDTHLIPYFGAKMLSEITKSDALQFRSQLAKLPGRSGNETLSPKTINHYMGVLSMVIAEASERYQFNNPIANVKRLKVPRKDIEPFKMEEVKKILATVRPDYKSYLTVRFFTGMRSGEVHGLRWKHVDFERRQILVRETFANGKTEYTKNDGSQREIDMSQTVYDALKVQETITKDHGEYVFCDSQGGALDNHNVTNRVWYPLLRLLGLKLRRPYQCRHTCATLWLGAGENPEWIARQLGHTTTEMLFRVYSRYVPNLTRKDGSAFDRLLTGAMSTTTVDESASTQSDTNEVTHA